MLSIVWLGVADILSLAVGTPSYYQKLGLLSNDVSDIYVPKYWVDLSFNSMAIIFCFLIVFYESANFKKYLGLNSLLIAIQKFSVSKQENV